MIDSAPQRRKTWTASLGQLSGRNLADNQSSPPPDIESTFTPGSATLSPAEIGILGQVLRSSHRADILSYSGLGLSSEDLRQLGRISSKYRSLLVPLTPAQVSELVQSIQVKLKSVGPTGSLLTDNPLPECAEGRSLIRMVQPVLPTAKGVDNLFNYYRLHRAGKLNPSS